MKESTRPYPAAFRHATAAQRIARQEAPAALEEPLPAEASHPVYFGRSERPLFGWLHNAERAPAASVGLVICSAFGDEAIRIQRTIRHLAEDAARMGIPALRFDYDGTGDSAGNDLDPERVHEWLGSIRFAAQSLQQWTGVERVCFAGIRLGALLAALAALEPDAAAAGLIAIAPVVSGRAYVRELRLLRRAIQAKRNIAHTEDDGVLETAGFLLSAQTQAALSAIDLTRLEQAPPARVLVLDRAELPADERWPQHLRNRGARVDYERVPGYPEMMLDAHDSVVPDAIVGAALRWLRDLAGEQAQAAPKETQATPHRRHAVLPPSAGREPLIGNEGGRPIVEWAVRLPGPERLFAIVSVPEEALPGQGPTGLKAVLLVNAGAVHRIGPCRLYVALARHLAQQGCIAMRLDIAGIGDSPPRAGSEENGVYTAHAVDDIAVAIEYLRREWSAGEIRCVGLCSGAYHSLKAAAASQPLRGIVAINPLTFFWKEGMSLGYPEHRVAQDIMRYRNNARSLSSWRKLLSGGVDLWALAHVLGRTALTQLLKPVWATARLLRISLREDLPSELLKVAHAGVDLQFIFAAMDPGVEILRDKGGATVDRLRARGRLGVEFIPDADHTFTDLAARKQLAALLARKLGQSA
jgi:alpha-beta hydrolase superfamily lysophospholipase